MRIISRVFGGYFGPFLDLFVKETQKKGTFFKIEKSDFWPVILWGWLSWVAMAKILVLARFRALKIKCLLLKSVRYLIGKVIWSGANLSGSDTPKLTFDSKIHYLVQNPEDWDQKKKVFITQTPTFICKSKIQIPWNTKIHNCATIELKFWVNEFFCEYLPSRYFSRPYGQNWESFVTEVKSENHEKISFALIELKIWVNEFWFVILEHLDGFYVKRGRTERVLLLK